MWPLATERSAFALVNVRLRLLEKAVRIMDKQWAAEQFKIVYFREITNSLLAQKLITEDEYLQISKRLEQMEIDSVEASPKSSTPPRKLSVIE